MLFINNIQVGCADDAGIPRYFGPSYHQDSRIATIIDWYIEDSSKHDFRTTRAFTDKVMEHLSTQYLPIKCTHISYPGPYTIVMSGSRKTDAARANHEAGLKNGTPGGYTWHHHEEIDFHSPDNIKCNMYLLKSSYHQTPHSGGVKKYEVLTRTPYS